MLTLLTSIKQSISINLMVLGLNPFKQNGKKKQTKEQKAKAAKKAVKEKQKAKAKAGGCEFC
jgi:hypothetical protein